MSMDKGNNHSHKGEKNRNSKLTKKQVEEIRDIYKNRKGFFWGKKELAKKYGIGEAQVYRIIKGKLWS